VTAALELEGLSVTYRPHGGGVPVRALRGAGLAVHAGEVVALVGESGSGKSTAAAVAVGLLAANARIEAGRVRLAGQDVTQAGERLWTGLRGRQVGFVPQDPATSLDPIRRVGAQVAEALTVHGTSPAVAWARVPDLLAEAGLVDPARVAQCFPHELSGGMRQRVLIAIALANDPPLLIADEPTSALDVTVQRQVLDHLDGLIRRRGIAVLLITHDLGVASERAGRLVIMQAGTVVESGPTGDVLRAPAHPYTRALLAAAPAFVRRRAPASTPPMKAAAPLLAVNGLGKRFPAGQHREVTVVDDVSFVVPAGSTFALVGVSGSGKTTTARMVARFETPTIGRVSFAGADITALAGGALRRLRQRLQFVHQNPYASLDPRFSIADIVAEPLVAFGIGTRRGRAEQVGRLLEEVGLGWEMASRRPAELSGGQRQRVAIARALALRPELLVLDEPISALDVSVQAQILDLLETLQRRLGLTYLLISHDLSVVRQVSHQVGVMRDGRLVESADTEAIFSAPRHPYTRELIAAMPRLAAPEAGRPVGTRNSPEGMFSGESPVVGCGGTQPS
jgi:peptide/nickel transport system ATP-binding protein